MKYNTILPVLMGFILMVCGCAVPGDGTGDPTTPPGGTGTTHTISGVVKEGLSGDPVSGARVVVGSQSAVTNAAGAFSFSYAAAQTVTGNVTIYKDATYSFWAALGVQIDVTQDPYFTIYLEKENTSPPPMISGGLPGTAQVNGYLSIGEVNEKGGASSASMMWYSAGATAYSLPILSGGSDCFLLVAYDLDGSAGPLPKVTQYLTHQNLTTNLTYDITALTPVTDVTLTGTTGTPFMADLKSPLRDTAGYVEGVLGAGSAHVGVYNPAGFPMVWKTYTQTPDSPASGYTTLRFNVGPTVAFGSTAALPAPADTVPAPAGIASGASWNGSTNTIAFTGGTGATMHMILLIDDGNSVGFIYTASPSVTIPADLYAGIIEPGSGWDVVIYPICSSQALGQLIGLQPPIGGISGVTDTQFSIVVPAAGGTGIWTDLIP